MIDRYALPHRQAFVWVSSHVSCGRLQFRTKSEARRYLEHGCAAVSHGRSVCGQCKGREPWFNGPPGPAQEAEAARLREQL